MAVHSTIFLTTAMARVRAFFDWLQARGGYSSPEVVSISVDAAICGFPPARAHAIAMAYVHDKGELRKPKAASPAHGKHRPAR